MGLVLAVFLIAIAFFLTTGSQGATIVVDDDGGPWSDHSTIGSAVEASSDGDTLIIHSGTYDEQVIVDRALGLVGNGSGLSIVNGLGGSATLMVVSEDVFLKNLTIMNATGSTWASGILVRADRALIDNCTVTDSVIGVRLEEASDCSVVNVMMARVQRGADLVRSPNNRIEGVVIGEPKVWFDNDPVERDTDLSEVINFAASSDQHYGWQDDTVPDHDGDTVDDWMEHGALPDFDFIMSTMGDWISDKRAGGNWQDTDYCWEMITKYNADHQLLPYFWTLGNHDITNYEYMVDGNPVRKERMGRNISGLNENNFAFMYNNVLFLNVAQTTYHQTLSGFQKAWIEYLIHRYEDHTTVILSHQAIYETTSRGEAKWTSWKTGYRSYMGIEWWQDLFDDNPQIIMFIHGHNEIATNTTAFDLHPESWDDDCTFVMVPANGHGKNYPDQLRWSSTFEISDETLEVRMWDSVDHSYVNDSTVAVPFSRTGMSNNVSDAGMEWFSIPKRVMDGQSWTWSNHFVSEGYRIDLVGSNVTEQLDNSDLTGFLAGTPLWLAVQGDKQASNIATGATDGFIRMAGGKEISIATSACNPTGQIEGKVPYNTAIAVPGGTYNLTCRIRTTNGSGTVDLKVTIPRYLDLSSKVWSKQVVSSNAPVNSTYRNCSAVFTIPNDEDCWFIKPFVRFDSGATYEMDSWSLKMVGNGDSTDDISVTVNGETHSVGGSLGTLEHTGFQLDNTTIDNTLDFNCSIDGNRVGIVRMIYQGPVLWSDDVTFGIVDEDQSRVLMEDRAPYNNRTTVMGFEGAGVGPEGFETVVVKGKFSHLHDDNDSSIDGEYSLQQMDMTRGIRFYRSDACTVANATISNFTTGVQIVSSNGLAIARSFIGGNQVGIRTSGRTGSTDLHFCDLADNSISAMNLNGNDVNATSNYWGETLYADIADLIFDGHDRTGLGNVGFTPWSNTSFKNLTLDDEPPVTTDDHVAGWTNEGYTINLTATDDLSGVHRTYYRIDNSSWSIGDSIVIEALADHSFDGVHLVEYYSIDLLGNWEEVKGFVLRVDTGPPELKVRFDPSKRRLVKEVSDDLDPEPVRKVMRSGYYRKFTMEDRAGNEARVRIIITRSYKGDWTIEKCSFYKYRIGDGPWTRFTSGERCAVRYLTIGRTIYEIEHIAANLSWRVDSYYNRAAGETRLTIIDGGRSTEFRTGIKVAVVTYCEGACDYSVP